MLKLPLGSTRAHTITALVMAVIAWGPSRMCEAGSIESVRLSVQLENHANVPSFILHSTQLQITRIFAAAGVEIVWNGDQASARTLIVLLLSGPMIDRQIGPRAVDPRVLAESFREVSRAYIFTERVIAAASKTDGNIGDALGNVIAHEMGHLLLPERGHATKGIMQPGYQFRDLSGRRFTPEQAAMIRLALMAMPNGQLYARQP